VKPSRQIRTRRFVVGCQSPCLNCQGA
jgi:hypothetical protein